MAFYKDMSHDNAFISHQEVGFPLFLHMELHLNYVFYPRIVAQTTFSNNTLLSVITLHIMAVLHSAQFKNQIKREIIKIDVNNNEKILFQLQSTKIQAFKTHVRDFYF